MVDKAKKEKFCWKNNTKNTCKRNWFLNLSALPKGGKYAKYTTSYDHVFL